jgi:hypothetical protein
MGGSYRSRALPRRERRNGPLSTLAPPRLSGRPERIFVSVDESLGRSTLSFAPSEVGAPIPIEGDPRGEQALAQARAIAATFPGAVVLGPHFHGPRVKPVARRGRR